MHGLEGLKHLATTTQPPALYDPGLLDHVAEVATETADHHARWLARTTGLLVGWSAGAAVSVAGRSSWMISPSALMSPTTGGSSSSRSPPSATKPINSKAGRRMVRSSRAMPCPAPLDPTIRIRRGRATRRTIASQTRVRTSTIPAHRSNRGASNLGPFFHAEKAGASPDRGGCLVWRRQALRARATPSRLQEPGLDAQEPDRCQQQRPDHATAAVDLCGGERCADDDRRSTGELENRCSAGVHAAATGGGVAVRVAARGQLGLDIIPLPVKLTLLPGFLSDYRLFRLFERRRRWCDSPFTKRRCHYRFSSARRILSRRDHTRPRYRPVGRPRPLVAELVTSLD